MTVSADKPLRGIVLMLGFCIVIPFADAIAKILGATFPLFQLIAVRFAMQAVIFVPLALMTGVSLFPSGRIAALNFVRTLLQMTGILLMFSALRLLPLADAVAIAFVMPFVMLLLGWFFLGEEVGPRRFIACAVGFCGTLLVVQPSFAAVGWGALLPLGVAVVFAVFMLVTRLVAPRMDPMAMQGASGLMALPVVLPLLVLPVADTAPLVGWSTVPVEAIWLFMALGVSGAVGHLFMSWSLRYAPSATLAPMQYLEIPIAALVGLAIFGEFPNGLALAGICVTIASGLYIVMRERATSRAAAPPAA